MRPVATRLRTTPLPRGGTDPAQVRLLTFRQSNITGPISERFLILIVWNDTDTPLAYLISFRSYGTWLHGDKRGAIDRFHNRYGAPYLPPNQAWQHHNCKQLKSCPFILGAKERCSVDKAIRETCNIRQWYLHALNVRTNHVHAVVTA